jgi:hypothetical protein
MKVREKCLLYIIMDVIIFQRLFYLFIYKKNNDNLNYNKDIHTFLFISNLLRKSNFNDYEKIFMNYKIYFDTFFG